MDGIPCRSGAGWKHRRRVTAASLIKHVFFDPAGEAERKGASIRGRRTCSYDSSRRRTGGLSAMYSAMNSYWRWSQQRYCCCRRPRPTSRTVETMSRVSTDGGGGGGPRVKGVGWKGSHAPAARRISVGQAALRVDAGGEQGCRPRENIGPRKETTARWESGDAHPASHRIVERKY